MMRITTQQRSDNSSILFSFCLILILILMSCFEPIIFCAAAGSGGGAPSVEQQCNAEFAKVGTCLNFATGKAAKPSDECCTTVKDIRKNNPVCLCYIIQQTHKGAASLKDLGLQEDKLLQLPDVCKLTDASVDQCPKLLNLSPSSPDYAIFTNSTSPGSGSGSATSTTTPTSSTGASTTTPMTKATPPSAGFMHGASTATVAIAAALVFICSVFHLHV